MRICEHCGAYMGDNAVQCTICGVKPIQETAAYVPAARAGKETPTCMSCDNVADIGDRALPDPSFYTNPYQLAEINSRLNKEKAIEFPVAPYTVPSVNKTVPPGPVYICRNCNTINSVDDTYCTVCGVKVNEKIRREIIRRERSGERAEVILPQEAVSPTPEFGRSTAFSTSLNTLEAALKPYVYNYNVTGDNNTVNAYGATNNSTQQAATICPYAPKEESVVNVVSEEPVQITAEEMKRERERILRTSKKKIREEANLWRGVWTAVVAVLMFLVLATFFFNNATYTQSHDIHNNQKLYKDSAGIDIVASVFEIVHLDSMYDSVKKAVNGVFKTNDPDKSLINGAYYEDVTMEVDKYTVFQNVLAHMLPVTLALALLFVVVNIIFLLIKAWSGYLRKKCYLITVIMFVLFLVSFLEILIMTAVVANSTPGIFDYTFGYGIIIALLVSLAVLFIQKFAGKRRPKSENERIQSLYGY